MLVQVTLIYIGIVIEQLFIITGRYEDRNKPELLPVISEIYLFLAGCSDRSPEFQKLQNHKWIWSSFFDSVE
jgi:hypothetical protein